MLEDKEYKDISFETMFEDALAQIPIYTKEWTNFNPSDPGITILENLTAFNLLSQTYLSRIDDAVGIKLLELAGIEAEPAGCSKVLLAAECEKKVACCSNQKFMVEDICFENNRPVTLGCGKVTGIFLQEGEKLTRMNGLFDRKLPAAEYIWGEAPAAGNKLYIVLDSLPEDTDAFIMYADVRQEFHRNPFPAENKGRNPFAHIRWQMYTKDGYKDIRVKDNTECFLQSGMLRFTLPKEKAAVYAHYDCQGYVIRGILETAYYDAAPVVKRLSAYLFEAWQKDSKGLCYTFPWDNIPRDNIPWNSIPWDTNESSLGEDPCIEVHCGMMEQGYVSVFILEEDSKYHKYAETDTQGMRGRYYRRERIGYGHYRIFFSKGKYGFAPCSAFNAVKIVIYDEEAMQRYHIGKVYGYHDQQFALSIKNILPDSFSLLVRMEGGSGDEYEFVKPESTKKNALKYYLDAEEGILHIVDAGNYAGAELFLCGLAVTRGAAGNVETGRVFYPEGLEGEIRITNVAKGQGGRDRDSFDSLKKKFADMLSRPLTAVSAEDYERIVMETPGLCIGKVKAVLSEEENTVEISALPAFKKLSQEADKIYRKQIKNHIEHFRPLSTKVKVKRAEYAAVDVDIVVKTKSHYNGCEDIIAGCIRECVDYVNFPRRFGEILKYEDIYRAVYALDCVQSILELSLTSRDTRLAEETKMNIKPAQTCLLCPGNITVRTRNQ